MESTNPHVFLAPTKITFSSYNWVEAPTSTCTSSNLYREDNIVFPSTTLPSLFLRFKHVHYNMEKNRYYNAYQLCSDLLLDLLMHLGSPHCLCSGYSWKNSNASFILQSPLRRRSMHQLSACREHTHFSSLTSSYTYQYLNPSPVRIPDYSFS